MDTTAIQVTSGEIFIYEVVQVVISYLRYNSCNCRSIKALARAWRHAALLALHWEGALMCRKRCHVLLNPRKLQPVPLMPPTRHPQLLFADDGELMERKETQDDNDEKEVGSQDQRHYTESDTRSATSSPVLLDDVLCADIADCACLLQEEALRRVYFESWARHGAVVASARLSKPYGSCRITMGGYMTAFYEQSTDRYSRERSQDCARLSDALHRQVSVSEGLEGIIGDVLYGRVASAMSAFEKSAKMEYLNDFFLEAFANDQLVSFSACAARLTSVWDLSQCRNLRHVTLTGEARLGLGNSSVDDVMVLMLVKGLAQLQQLDLHSCTKLTRASMDSIKTHCKALTHLSITDCKEIGDIEIDTLLSPEEPSTPPSSNDARGRGLASTLTSLNLSGLSKITSEVLGNLPEFTELRVLNLSRCTRLSVDGLCFVGWLSSLEELYLDGCRGVLGLCLTCFASLGSLRVLSLDNCSNISVDGIASLVTLQNGEVAPIAGSLEKLVVTDTNCGNDSDLEKIRCFRKLKHLEFSALKGTSSRAWTHMQTLHNLETLRICDACLVFATAFKSALSFQHHRKLRVLRTGPFVVDDAAMESIAKCLAGTLEELHVDTCDATDRGLQALSQCSKLHLLKLALKDHVTEGGFAALCSIYSLQVLKITRFLKANSRCLEHLNGLRQLRWLQLSNCGETTHAIMPVLASLPLLHHLDLSGNTWVSNSCLLHVALLCRPPHNGFSSLFSLDVSYSSDTSEDVVLQVASACPSLKYVHAFGCQKFFSGDTYSSDGVHFLPDGIIVFR